MNRDVMVPYRSKLRPGVYLGPCHPLMNLDVPSSHYVAVKIPDDKWVIAIRFNDEFHFIEKNDDSSVVVKAED